ncbi:MAG: hypothetical protein JJU05_11000 [Verrucomicrobia bacterium]|nr:hypothetical protein [Verrucomicrobiota bacterium]MCH8527378.1 hypothetical protein [Kiritimatiellia bacterium]
MMKLRFALSVVSLLVFTARAQFGAPQPGASPHPTGDPPFNITSSSLIGDGSEGNHVKAAAVLADGSVIIGGHFGDVPFARNATLVNGAKASDPWLVLRLTGDGRRVLGALRFPNTISDIAVDGREGVYIAAGESGMFAFTPRLDRQVFHHKDIGFAYRVDAGPGGYHAVLSPSNIERRETNGGSGQIRVFNPMGEQIQQFGGHRNTLDIAIDETTRAVHFTGWRQARSWQPDGDQRTLPVQIAYIRSVGFDGEIRWTGYDWPTDRSDPNFINNGDNNMADTRGYRITLGPDGKLYVAYEVAGGNHIFRYSPFSITDRVTNRFARAPDHYHQFHNTRSEHKTFIGVHDPADGAFITGQQFTARINNRGNAWRMTGGGITVSENGHVWFAGNSAAGVPYTFAPATAPGYIGGATLHTMSTDLGTMEYGIYTGAGRMHTVSARILDGNPNPVVVFGGVSPPLRASSGEYILHHYPLQPARNGETNGFFKIINGRGGQQ